MRRFRFFLGLSLASLPAACGGGDASSTAADSSTGGCPEGDWNCACFANNTCNDGLVCMAGSCVPDPGETGDETAGDGDSSAGDGDTTTGDGTTGDGTAGDGDGTAGDGDGTAGDGDGTAGDGDGTAGDGDGTAGDGDGTAGDGDGTSGDGDGTAGDGDGTSGDGDGTSGGDGDGTAGDGTTGDGDGTSGDGTTGDGDGTAGDGTAGDGDGTAGDGDGTAGDGDGTAGDGDGTTGDGDGTAGDGDGTTGDGDGTAGDGTTGDGTTGDGTTGDGDGTTGDGDGTTGDGDGDGCTPFATRCDAGDNVETCNAAGTTWNLTSICPDICLSGSCVASGTCTANEMRCNGNLIEQCNATGTGWLVLDACTFGCDPGNYTCLGDCTPGERRCIGSQTQECDAGAQWVDDVNCGANTCHSGECAQGTVTLTGATQEWCGEYWIDDTLTVGAVSTINVGSCGWLKIHANSIVIDASSQINGDFVNGCHTEGNGTNDNDCADGASGAGHASNGGNGQSGGPAGGSAYGNRTELTVEPGACGGDQTYSSPDRAGGDGGAEISLIAETIDIQGTVTADGSDGQGGSSCNAGAGGGSGGSVLLYGGQVTLGAGAVLSADGGSGGFNSSGYSGGAGSDGFVKVAYGNDLASSVVGSMIGSTIETVAPPMILSSSTHPDENAWYNDGFAMAQLAWQRPSNYAVNGYYTSFSTTEYDVPNATDAFTTAEGHTQLYTDGTWNYDGANYFHISTLDSGNELGTMEHNFRIQVNDDPPAVSSSSHASEATFYDLPNVLLTWSDAHASANYTDYVYIWDRLADTLPTPTFGAHTTIKSLNFPGTPDGIWFLHVISIDTMGYPNRTAEHFRVNVGIEPGLGNIAGTVTDDSAIPVPIVGADITVNGGIWGVISVTGGAYSFNDQVYDTLTSGWPQWVVTADADGYQPSTQLIDVMTAGTSPLNFVLTPDP